MATNTTQKQAAKQFVQDWSGKGYEKGETSRFWIALLQNVYGIQDATKFMEFEIPVKTILKEKGSDFIDGYIPSTKVLIEQKGSKIKLSEKYRQSDGSELTPYQQARRYAAGLPLSMAPRWIVACNFDTFEVHDMEHPNDAPEVIQLADLEKEYHRLSFLVDDTNVHLKKELEVSIQAGEIVGVLYDKILSQYKDPENPETQKALNKLCVRLVFCLYAEDAGIFGTKNMFHDYMSQFPASMFREQLIKLFRILDQKPEDRDPYEDERLLAFPYVNGGMFAGDIEIPRINEEIRTLILQRASDDFDWSQISPTIFGAVFESTLNPETRRSGGMHYTSIENIHKVIDPLFLNDLKAELADIRATSVAKTKKDRAYAFQDKLANLKFFDPACGSGNFLTESYTSLRRLENEALRIIYGSDRVIGEFADPIKVSINQFYGIEINDFACSVAQTALWIAESQMMAATDEIVGFNLDPLPLKTYTNIHEGNALRMDWNEVIPASELNYIMGNPPFIGQSVRTDSQSDDMALIFGKGSVETKQDYVICWYKKGLEYMNQAEKGHIKAAFVSTNSICQGESVPTFWKGMIDSGCYIQFAHTTFIWNSEATNKAHVHCVIVGFGTLPCDRKYIFTDGEKREVTHINPYLIDAPDIWLANRVNKPFEGLPTMTTGSPATDDGGLLLTVEEKDALLLSYPILEKYIRPFIGAREFLHDRIGTFSRYCLWFVNGNPSDYANIPEIKQRFQKVRALRESSNADRIQKMAQYPYLFCQIRQPSTEYLVIPRHSSENRKYIPFGFVSPEIIAGDACTILPDVSMYHFGIMTSRVHMAWMRVTCGRLKSDFRYSPSVYNNFPWPLSNEAQKAKIESTAQAILDARKLYPDSCLSDLYGENVMPIELGRAHTANDNAVMDAYGIPRNASDDEILAHLFKMYQEQTK